MQALDDRHQLTITEHAGGRLAAFRRPVTRRSYKPALELHLGDPGKYVAQEVHPASLPAGAEQHRLDGLGRDGVASEMTSCTPLVESRLHNLPGVLADKIVTVSPIRRPSIEHRHGQAQAQMATEARYTIAGCVKCLTIARRITARRPILGH
jgi:hypothetical protein